MPKQRVTLARAFDEVIQLFRVTDNVSDGFYFFARMFYRQVELMRVAIYVNCFVVDVSYLGC